MLKRFAIVVDEYFVGAVYLRQRHRRHHLHPQGPQQDPSHHRDGNGAKEDDAPAQQQQDRGAPQPLHACGCFHSRRHRYYERFSASSFADNQVEGDITAGEDPMVRAAALEALGNMNGTIVAVDPDSGRILAMVNQKLALSAGAQPCSTIKVAVALAALSENVITKDTRSPAGQVLARGPDHGAGEIQQCLL